MINKDDMLYKESLSSDKTEALYISLITLFFLIFLWRLISHGLDILAIVSLVFGGMFLFYSVNYRTLNILLTPEHLKLTFGVIAWTLPLESIEDCDLDELPPIKRFGGAGIHFMFVRKRYRASFNFLEYSRVVIALKRKVGPVQDISFSTRYPEDLLRIMRDRVSLQKID